MAKKISQREIENIPKGVRDDIIRAAWEDDVSFESIAMQFGQSEQNVIKLMKTVMKPKMFTIWRQRVKGRAKKYFHKYITLEKFNLDSEQSYMVTQ